MEGPGRAHRVLTGQAVGDQQGFHRLRHRGDLSHLIHQTLVEGDASGGIQDQDVKALQFRRLQGALGDLDRAFARHDRQGRDLNLLGERSQLLHGRRTTRVQRGHHDLLLVELCQAQCQLGRAGSLARALQAGHQDHGGRGGVQIDADRLLATQHLDQAIIDDLDYLIGRLDRADDLLAFGLFAGEGDEVLDHGQGDVGLQQGHAHLAHRLGNVLFGQGAAAGDPVKDACQSLVQSLEHQNLKSRTKRPQPQRTITSAGGLSRLIPRRMRGSSGWRARGQLAPEAAVYGGKPGKGQVGPHSAEPQGTELHKFRYAGTRRLSFRGMARLSLIFKESP